MSELYITSDIHFSHARILDYCASSRPFSYLDEMNDAIIENWNNKVQKDSIVYILGDLSFAKPSHTIELLNRLNGTLRLIVGNHDNDKYLRSEEFCNRFEWMKMYHEEKIMDIPIVMFHFPILEWHHRHYGTIHVHGHQLKKNPEKLSCRRYDVGIDGSPDFAPYHMHTLIQDVINRTTGV